MSSGLRKIKKKDPVSMSIMKTSPELSGSIFGFGRIGSGKTTSLMSFAQIYRDNPSRGYKIFDLWGGDRNEHLFWALPSNKEKYWKNAKKVLRLNSVGIKQYKVNLLYPLLGKLPKQLPFNPPHVFSKIFTIPIKDVELRDISLVIGNLSLQVEGLWEDIRYKIKKNTSIPRTLKILKDNKGENTTFYKNVIKPFTRELFLQEDSCQFNIDLKKEIMDKETISVLCLEFVKEEHRLFILGYFLRKMAEILDASGRRNKTILIIREASEFFRATEQSIVPERKKIFRNVLSNFMRMGRRGAHLLLDTQSVSETKGLLSGSQDLTLLGKLPSEADRKDATDQLFRDNLITKRQITQIATLEPGQFMVCPSGKPAFFQYFLLPKTRFWEEGSGNFYKSVWKNSIDRWCNFDEERKLLKERYIKEEEEIQNEEKIKKENENIKKAIDKKIQQQNKEDEKAVQKVKKAPIKTQINEVKIRETSPDEWGMEDEY